ncbi:MAG: sulfite exporter TauE/SafE family protein [Burkholderiaceae bacterium]
MTLADYPLGFYLGAAFAVLITGVIKGGFGGAAGGLAVPIMSLWISPVVAAGVMLPILCAMDMIGVRAYWKKWSWPVLRPVFVGAVIGIGIGSLMFQSLSVQQLKLIVGLIAVTFVLNKWLSLADRLVQLLKRTRSEMGPVGGVFWGSVSGFTSTLAHAGGPPFSVYILGRQIDRTTVVASASLYFLFMNYTKIIPYYLLGQLSPSNLQLSLVFAPLAPVGIGVGIWLHKRISERIFYQTSYLLLFSTGLKLIWDALA